MNFLQNPIQKDNLSGSFSLSAECGPADIIPSKPKTGIFPDMYHLSGNQIIAHSLSYSPESVLSMLCGVMVM